MQEYAEHRDTDEQIEAIRRTVLVLEQRLNALACEHATLRQRYDDRLMEEAEREVERDEHGNRIVRVPRPKSEVTEAVIHSTLPPGTVIYFYDE